MSDECRQAELLTSHHRQYRHLDKLSLLLPVLGLALGIGGIIYVVWNGMKI